MSRILKQGPNRRVSDCFYGTGTSHRRIHGISVIDADAMRTLRLFRICSARAVWLGKRWVRTTPGAELAWCDPTDAHDAGCLELT